MKVRKLKVFKPLATLAVLYFMCAKILQVMANQTETVSQESAKSYLETSQRITRILDNFMASGYDKRVRPNYGGPPVEVNVTMRILSISSVSEVMMDFTADFYFRQTWHDPRLAFKKLPNISTLYVGAEVSKKIWLPDTFFGNEKMAYFHEATTPNVFLRIDHSGEVYRSIRLTVTSSCPMNLQYFPMDKQRCTIEAESYGYNIKDIIYRWRDDKAVERDNQISLPQFSIDKTEQRYRLEKLSSVISWVSFWLHRNASPARVQLGVTTVLTMTTLMSSTNAALPKISYVKSIDIFLGTCFIMVFAALLEYATVGYLGKRIAMRKAHAQHAHSMGIQRPMITQYQTGHSGLPEPTPPLDHNQEPSAFGAQTVPLIMARQHHGSQPRDELVTMAAAAAAETPFGDTPFATSQSNQNLSFVMDQRAGLNSRRDLSPPEAPERHCSHLWTRHLRDISTTKSLHDSHNLQCCPHASLSSHILGQQQQPDYYQEPFFKGGHQCHGNRFKSRGHDSGNTGCRCSTNHDQISCTLPRNRSFTCAGNHSADKSQQAIHVLEASSKMADQKRARLCPADTKGASTHLPPSYGPTSGSAAAAATAAAATFINLHRKNKGLPPSTNPNFTQFAWLAQQNRHLETIFGIRPSDIDKYSRVVFPVCFVCFQLMYWIVYLHISAFLEFDQQDDLSPV